MDGARGPKPPSVAVRMLGGFDVTLPDGVTAGPWERPAARRLVQLLLLSPRHQAAREQIAETLFPHLPPARAANAVSKALTMARAALREDDIGPLIDADRATIRLRSDVDLHIDVADLQQAARAALDETRHDETALGDLRGRDFTLLPDEPYAEWTRQLRDELTRLHTDVLIAYAHSCAPDRQQQAWADVVEHQPTNETANAALIELYLAAGQRDRAIRTYHRCRAALLDDLGVEPSPELTALLADEMTPNREAATAPPTAPNTTPLTTTIGRDDLLARLLRTCDRPDHPRAVAVAGPAGIGKTTLVRELVRQLTTRGWDVREVTAAPDDRLSPYAGLRALLQQLIEPTTRSRYPLLDSVVTGDTAAVASTPEATRSRIAQELTALLDDAAATRPLAIVLDDAHWIDDALRALVARVAAGPSRRWLLVLVARSDEPSAALPDLPLDTPRLEVPPLVPDDMRALVRTELPTADTDVVEQIVQRSRGNAFFGLELARQWLLGGTPEAGAVRVPDRIVELLSRRIETCSAPARQLVPLVALAGAEATYELVLRTGAHHDVAGSSERCIRALDELAAAHLLVETPTALRLLHPLLRDAALATINPIRRATLHRMLADTLTAIHGDPTTVARHRIAAFAAARLIDYATEAADAGFTAGALARSLFANDAAMDLLRGALDAYAVVPAEAADRLRPRAVTAWTTIADMHLDGEDGEAATAAAQVAIALARTDDERAEAWAKLAGVAYRRGDMAEYGATIEEALRAMTGESPLAHARLTSDLGWCWHREGRHDESRLLLEQAREVLRTGPPDHPAYVRVLDRLALSTAWQDPVAALTIADEALEAARRTDDASLEAVVLLHRAEILSMDERPVDALADLDTAAHRFGVAADRYMQAVCLWVRAVVLERAGDLDGALAAREAEAELLVEVGNLRHLADSHRHRANLLAALGRAQESREARETALDTARRCGDAAVLARVEADLTDPLVTTGRVREG